MNVIFKVEGIDCANCAAKAERHVAKQKGIEEVSFNFMTQKLHVSYADEFDSTIEEIIKNALQKVEKNVILTRI